MIDMIEKCKYVHPLEESALEKLNNALKFEDQLACYYKNYTEKMMLPDLLGKTVMVTHKQFPELYEIALRICDLINFNVPKIYVYEDFYYGIDSRGMTCPWIEISAKTLEDFTEDELIFLIAKEINNIFLKHTYYYEIIDHTKKYIHGHITVPGSDTIKKVDILPMMTWARIACYTSDCFGYIMNGNLTACTSAILKMVLNSSFLADHVNVKEFINQSSEINSLNEDACNKSKYDEMVPYACFRIKNLIGYASSWRGINAVKNKGEFK